MFMLVGYICLIDGLMEDISLPYTPGQKFIEFFFDELLHRDNGRNQQMVNSGMETHHISTNLCNNIGVGAMATVQCP